MPDNFANDVMAKWFSELEPLASGKETWGESLTHEQLAAYHQDQIKTNNYKGDLQQFISDYRLEFEAWILEQNFDLSGVKTLLIEISW